MFVFPIDDACVISKLIMTIDDKDIIQTIILERKLYTKINKDVNHNEKNIFKIEK